MIEKRNNIHDLRVCSVCGRDKNVVVHHNSYFPEKLALLCLRCHYVVHSYDSLQLLQLAFITEQYSENWKNYADNKKDIEKLRYRKKKAKAKAEDQIEVLDDFLIERNMAVDLLTHWNEADEIQ